MGLRPMVFPAQLRGPGGVEVAKPYEVKSVSTVEVFQHPLHEELRPAVRVVGVLGMLLVHGNTNGFAVGGTGGGKNDIAHTSFGQCGYQSKAFAHVVRIELRRVRYRNTNICMCGEVNAGSDFVLADDGVDQRRIANAAFVKFRRLVYGISMTFYKVIEYHYRLAALYQKINGGTSDIPGPAGHKDRHEASGFRITKALESLPQTHRTTGKADVVMKPRFALLVMYLILPRATGILLFYRDLFIPH
jgi:hypothetical protein